MPAYSLKEINDRISKLKEELQDWEQKKTIRCAPTTVVRTDQGFSPGVGSWR